METSVQSAVIIKIPIPFGEFFPIIAYFPLLHKDVNGKKPAFQLRKERSITISKKKFFIQGTILTLISFFLRITNIFYRSYLSSRIGPDGMGLYQLILSVFMLAVTLSTSGISLAVTRMVSAAIAKNQRDTISSIVSKCFLFCLGLSGMISLLLVVFSDFAAVFLLGNPDAAACLRILGIGLPFMSLCTCMKGYFLAVEEGVSGGIADTLEQLLTIGATVMLFNIFAVSSMEAACIAAVAASTLGEIVSFCWDFYSYRKSLRKNAPGAKRKSTGVLYGLTHIALPCTLSSAARSMLSTGENLLIPIELQKGGRSYKSAMSDYGLLQGMAIPLLYFPSAFLASFAFLLIPQISSEREVNHRRHVAYIAEQAISSALSFGILAAAVFFVFGKEWGILFYGSEEAGRFISLLSPLVPLMYLDIVVDNLLKGLDQQFNSMKYNMADAALRVLLVLIFLRIFGIQAYIAIIFFSTIFNAGLSITKVVTVSKLSMGFLLKLVYQIPLALSSVFAAEALTGNSGLDPMWNLILQLVLSCGIYAPVCLAIGWIGKKKSKDPASVKAGSGTSKPYSGVISGTRITR